MDDPVVGVNSPSAIRGRYTQTGLTWWPVLAFMPARLVFAFLAQGSVAAALALAGSASPWGRAAAWWPVYSTVTDVLCLGALFLLTRREGLRIRTLFGVASWKAGVRQLAWTPLYLLAVAPGAIAANRITVAFYASELPPMISVVRLPPVGVVYAMLVWPILWVVTEELVYLGYLLPRLEALTGRTSAAVVLVAFFWGLQHIAIPFIPDATYLVSRALAAFAAVSLFPVVFALWRRRLVPLIGAHYVADLATAYLATLLPILQR